MIWLLVLLAIPALAAADSPALKRWAVLTGSSLRQSGFNDRLTAELSQAGIELVERERLDVILREWSLASLSSAAGAAERVRLGRLLRADALLLLSEGQEGGRPHLRAVVCDGRAGARLRVEYMPAAATDIEPTVAALRELITGTQNQFSDGLRQVYAVLPFINDGLTREHDRFRDAWARLLAESLGSLPGTAVLEVEEAQSLATEMKIAGGPARVVPVVVAADYRVEGVSGTNAPVVRFVVRRQGGGQAGETKSEHAVPLPAATA
jgi:hypothetical protein